MAQDKLDIVRKLLAKAEGAATPGEAEVYTAKALELMARHGIDEALLEAKKERREQVVVRKIEVDQPYSEAKARLLAWTASALGSKSVLHYTGGRRTRIKAVSIVGFESDLDRIEILYTSLLLQATSQVVHQNPPAWIVMGPQTVAAHRRAWLHGFATGVHAKLKAAHEAAVAQAVAEEQTGDGTPGTAVVLADRKTQVENFYEETFTNLSKAKRPRLGGTGFDKGYAAGQRANTDQTTVANRRQAIHS